MPENVDMNLKIFPLKMMFRKYEQNWVRLNNLIKSFFPSQEIRNDEKVTETTFEALLDWSQSP